MTTTPEAAARVTEYTVSCVPPEHVGYRRWSYQVSESTLGRWTVVRNGFVYDQAGNRRNPHRLPDKEKAGFFFELDEAMALAKKLAASMTIHGHTVANALAWAGACDV